MDACKMLLAWLKKILCPTKLIIIPLANKRLTKKLMNAMTKKPNLYKSENLFPHICKIQEPILMILKERNYVKESSLVIMI